MGYLHIGHSEFVTFIDDRALAHLKVVILSALRSGQGLSLTLRRDAELGSGRETFWINPSTDLRFQFDGSRPPRLNHTWLRQMAESSKGSTGLFIMKEPSESQRDTAESQRDTA